MRPLRILIVDTETNGLDPAKNQVVEVGAVLWDVPRSSVVTAFSSILAAPGNAAEAVNGVPPSIVAEVTVGMSLRAWDFIDDLSHNADAFVAHSAAFDRSFFPHHIAERLPWICTLQDVVFPRQCSSMALSSIALAHGLGVASAHRALTDCLLIARLLERCAELGHDVGAMLERAMLPRVKVIALHPFEQNEEAKAAGFAFDRPSRTWSKRVIADEVPGLQLLPFRTRVEGSPNA